MRVPHLSFVPTPLGWVPQVAASLAVAAHIAEAEREVEHQQVKAHAAADVRKARADRRWAPPWRCDKCNKYTSGARSKCTCGHVGSTNDEGARTSYERAHRRRRKAR